MVLVLSVSGFGLLHNLRDTSTLFLRQSTFDIQQSALVAAAGRDVPLCGQESSQKNKILTDSSTKMAER